MTLVDLGVLVGCEAQGAGIAAGSVRPSSQHRFVVEVEVVR